MSRLFISNREVAFINDAIKELFKDILGQKIYYYAISTMATKIHSVYDEAPDKIFEKPVVLEALVGQPSWETKHNQFGMEQINKIEVFLQQKDLLDKGITPREGDFFTYGDTAYEIVSYMNMSNIFGQEEYECGYKMVGRLARPGLFDPKRLFPPVKDDGTPLLESDKVQRTFVQQRGLAENEQGLTNDTRQIKQRLGDDMAEPILGDEPKKVTLNPDNPDLDSSFYHE